MTDEPEITMKTDEKGAGTPEPAAKLFTQEDVDQIVSTRLKAERERREREDQTKAKQAEEQARIAKLEGEERLKAEYEQEMRKRDDELSELKRTLAISKAEGELARQGLPTEFAENLLGQDDEETARRITEFSKAVSDLVAQQVRESLNHGTPSSSGAVPSADDAMGIRLDRLMGIKR